MSPDGSDETPKPADSVHKSAAMLFDEHPEYSEAFYNASNQKEQSVKEVIEGIHRYPTLIDKLRNHNRPFKVLLLGQGAGRLEIPVIHSLVEERGTETGVQIDCVEPSQRANKMFSNGLYEAGLSDIVIKPYEKGFEEFEPEHEYDLALSSQSFQYIENWGPRSDNRQHKENNPIAKFRKIVGKEGVGIVLIQSAIGDVGDLRRICNIGLKYMNPDIDPLKGTLERTAEDFGLDLFSLYLGSRFTNVDYQLNVFKHLFPDSVQHPDSAIFNPTQEGKNLLTFLIRTDWDKLPQETKDKLLDTVIFPNIFTTNFAADFIWGRDKCIWLSSLVPQQDSKTEIFDGLKLIHGDQIDTDAPENRALLTY